eukprot:11328050-Alexandrium_andersonii.AAC.1
MPPAHDRVRQVILLFDEPSRGQSVTQLVQGQELIDRMPSDAHPVKEAIPQAVLAAGSQRPARERPDGPLE